MDAEEQLHRPGEEGEVAPLHVHRPVRHELLDVQLCEVLQEGDEPLGDRE